MPETDLDEPEVEDEELETGTIEDEEEEEGCGWHGTHPNSHPRWA